MSSVSIRGFRSSFGLRLLFRRPLRSTVPPSKMTPSMRNRLCRRLFAIMRALEDMPREAKRFALWLDQPIEERRPRRETPLRFGWPPGWRIRSTHEVDEILKECHWLVRSMPRARHVVRLSLRTQSEFEVLAVPGKRPSLALVLN